jgi:hypothetical protein
MKVPNEYRIGEAIKYGENTNSPIVRRCGYLESTNDYGNSGAFLLPRNRKATGYFFLVIASDGLGWEHISITVIPEQRCPTWEEMCYIKSLFWDDEEAVMQLHPPHSTWVNNHPYCLHLWRPIAEPIALPPPEMVGIIL